MKIFLATIFTISILNAACSKYTQPANAGQMEVDSSSYDLGGFTCGKQEPTVQIFYPKALDKGPFPIATFGHGMGGTIIKRLCESVASLGIIVVAPATSAGECSTHWQDMLHALDGSKHNINLHNALEFVDWSRTAIFGHSMGGGNTIDATAFALLEENRDRYNVKAALASHAFKNGDTATPNITIPMMFVSGEEDRRGNIRKQYNDCQGYPKVLAMVKDAQHQEPQNEGRLNPWFAHFLGCHLANLETSCSKVYGDGAESMCFAQSMKICEFTKEDGISYNPIEGQPQDDDDSQNTNNGQPKDGDGQPKDGDGQPKDDGDQDCDQLTDDKKWSTRCSRIVKKGKCDKKAVKEKWCAKSCCLDNLKRF